MRSDLLAGCPAWLCEAPARLWQHVWPEDRMLQLALYCAFGLGALTLLVLLQVLLCALWGAALAILSAALRDTMQVVGFALSIGIFLSPVLFPAHMFPADWRWMLWINPMTAWVSGFQAVLLQGAWPDWPVWAGCLAWLAAGAALLELVLRRSRDQLVDWL